MWHADAMAYIEVVPDEDWTDDEDEEWEDDEEEFEDDEEEEEDWE